MDVLAKNHDDLTMFYLGDRPGEANVFEIWESGGSRGDSVTPSTYSAAYRDWMCDKLVAELERNGGGLLSLGCGNAAVEARVVRQGYRVLAIDAMAEAVALARAKGVDARCADIYQWTPDEPWSVIYIDGVLGHLYDPRAGLVPILRRIRTWLVSRGGSSSGVATLIASNDAPSSGGGVQKAPGVNGFYWLSAQYMREEVLRAGFGSSVTGEFRYRRPVSGERVRSIVSGYTEPEEKRTAITGVAG
jgi:SAM-dependent methyltransferase